MSAGQMVGRGLLTFALFITVIVTLVIDWTVSHAVDPAWQPHARYHILLYHGTLLIFSGAALAALWGPTRYLAVAPELGWLVVVAFWLPFFPAALFPEVSVYATPEMAERAVPINLILGGLFLLIGTAGWWLARVPAPPGPAKAALVRTAAEGRAIWVVGDCYSFLAEGEDTGGQYALWEAVVPPGGGPPPHVHAREEEGFYVLEGEMTFHAAGKPVKAGPGTFLNLPRGVPHHFRNESDRPARLLILVAPAGLEKMFQRTGIPASDRHATPPPVNPAEIERILRIAPEFGVTILLPPGAHP